MTTKAKVPQPCPRCLSLAFNRKIRAETVMPIPETPPLSIEDCGEHSPPNTPICFDCQAAENLAKFDILAGWGATEPGGVKHPLRPKGMDFAARRIVVGNERQEQLRLPEDIRPLYGLVGAGYVRPSKGEDALGDHHAWLGAVGIHMGVRDPLGPQGAPI